MRIIPTTACGSAEDFGADQHHTTLGRLSSLGPTPALVYTKILEAGVQPPLASEHGIFGAVSLTRTLAPDGAARGTTGRRPTVPLLHAAYSTAGPPRIAWLKRPRARRSPAAPGVMHTPPYPVSPTGKEAAGLLPLPKGRPP